MFALRDFAKRRNSQSGFTLVELLIVIAIIAILASVAMGGVFLSSRRRAEDAARRADMKALQTALEQYYLDNSMYFNNGTECIDFASRSSSYLPQPLDTSRMTASDCTATTYCVCNRLGASEPNGNSAADDCSFSQNSTNGYFCIVNLQ